MKTDLYAMPKEWANTEKLIKHYKIEFSKKDLCHHLTKFMDVDVQFVHNTEDRNLDYFKVIHEITVPTVLGMLNLYIIMKLYKDETVTVEVSTNKTDTVTKSITVHEMINTINKEFNLNYYLEHETLEK